MQRWLICLALLQLTLASCAAECGTCSISDTPYSCLSCPSSSPLTYLSSCPSQPPFFSTLAGIAGAVTILHLLMLCLGIGVYRQVFQNIQLVSLVSWRYGFQGGSFGLQGTNLAVVRSNEFIEIFGYQFLVLCIVMLLFGGALVAVGKVSQTPTAIFIRRKRIIFPVRVLTFSFNIILFSALAQLTATPASELKPLSMALAIGGLFAAFTSLVFLWGVARRMGARGQDPNYYVLVQEMVSVKWWYRNNSLLCLLTRGGIMLAFVVLFSSPQIAGLIMMGLQFSYTAYLIIAIRLTKIRYFVVLAANSLLMIGIILVAYLGATSPLDSPIWINTSKAYLGMYFSLVGMFFVASVAELIMRREIVIRQFRGLLSWIKGEDQADKIVLEKHQQGSHRQRVANFHRNLLYKPQPIHIQMAVIS